MNKIVLEKIFKEKKLDAIISFSQQTRIWYTKLKATAGYLFIEPKNATLLIDARYIEFARENAKNADVKLLTPNSLKEFLPTLNYKKIGYESDYMTVDELNTIKKWFADKEVEFIPISGQGLRIYKTKEEADKISKAAQIGLDAFDELVPQLKEGMTELEIAAKLEYLFKIKGAERDSFDTIIASGPRAAMPHARPTNRKIRHGELIKMDFGTIYEGYMSDTTRTIEFGKIENPKLLKIKDIVYQAQQAGIRAIKPGVSAKYIDKICRDYIENEGYGEYFVHSTGHGLGIDIHELPSIAKSNPKLLEAGNVITVEPGIYIEGLGGVRFEDDILVTKDGYINLSDKNHAK